MGLDHCRPEAGREFQALSMAPPDRPSHPAAHAVAVAASHLSRSPRMSRSGRLARRRWILAADEGAHMSLATREGEFSMPMPELLKGLMAA